MFCALSKQKQMLIGAHSQYVILIKTMEKQRFLVTWVWEMNGEKKKNVIPQKPFSLSFM